MRTILTLLLTTAMLAAGATAASARVHVAVGIGDQHAAMFSDPHFRSLHIRKARYFIRWDAMRHPDALAAADAYVRAARAAHVSVLLHISTEDLRPGHGALPSPRAYRRWVGRLVRHFRRLGVRDWGVWNEENHRSQPTSRSPRRAAQYFREMRAVCHHCSIVALDVLDQRGVASYISRFFRALSPYLRRHATIIGIHNYSDTNRRRSRGTRTIIAAVRRYDRRARFWMTETGGVVNFGRSFPCNVRRAASSVGYMFRLAREFRHSVSRLYAYNWYGSDCNGFDAGLVSASGARRPGWYAFRKSVRGFTR